MSNRRYEYPGRSGDDREDLSRRYNSRSSRHTYDRAHHLSKPAPSRRTRWPPSPSVEEEEKSLRREVGARGLGRSDEVSERGSVDQEPIIIDVAPPKPPRPQQDPRQRTDKKSSSSGVPTPPTSDDEKAARGRRHGTRLETAFLPEMRREPSPYHFAASSTAKPTPPQSSSRPTNTSATTSSTSTQPTSAPGSARVVPSDGNVTPRLRKDRPTTTESPRSSTAVVDDDLGELEARVRRNERRSARYSFTKPELTAEPESMGSEELPLRPASARRPLFNDDNRRHTDSRMEVPRDQVVENMRKPAPLKVANLVREATGQQSPASPSRTPTTKLSSRNSPRTSSEEISRYPPSPPRSPRPCADHARESASAAKRRSLQSSAEASLTTSPQASPQLSSTLPATSSGWQNAFDSNAARASRPTTRLATSTGVDDQPRPSRHELPPTTRTESLPYPVDDFVATMPEERDHQYYPDTLRPMDPSPLIAKTLSRAGTPMASNPTSLRPALPKHHSYAETAPTTPISPNPALPPRSARIPSISTLKTVAPPAPITAALPPCPRSQYTSGYSDWYTLADLNDFDICPDCLRDVFEPTYFADFFVPTRPGTRDPTAKIRCDFSNAWMRLAWLLILQRQLSSLNLLKSVYNHLQQARPCPDTEPTQHQWFTIWDNETMKPLRDFHICATDVQTLLLLLPGLRGFFTPYPIRASTNNTIPPMDPTPRLCSLRAIHNNRFPVYLDTIISLHESALALGPGKVPTMTSFTELVKHKLDLDECPRDNIMQGAKWFYIPSLPEFTVCEDCHDDVIVPLLRADSDLAMRFNRSRQYLPESSRSARDSVNSLTDVAKEASCSLYSPRMRKVFRRAVEDNDLKYLAKKAKERKDKEVKLQRQAQPLIARVREIDDAVDRYARRTGYEREIARLEVERRELEDELEEYREEWAYWE